MIKAEKTETHPKRLQRDMSMEKRQNYKEEMKQYGADQMGAQILTSARQIKGKKVLQK